MPKAGTSITLPSGNTAHPSHFAPPSKSPTMIQALSLGLKINTDLLLHDMGPGLADGRSDYDATGQEWRTAPLWAAGLSQAVNGSRNYLHDGRARTIEEAIVWHGGEGRGARDRFAALSVDQRKALVAFVKSL